MYRLKTEKTLVNGVFKVTLSVDEISKADQDLIDQFGEPTADFGGSFGTGGSAYTLPTKIRKIKTQLPVVQSFDSADNDATTSKGRANTWASTMQTRIQSALDTLQTNTDDFTGTTLTELT